MRVAGLLAGTQGGVQNEVPTWPYVCSPANALKEQFVDDAGADHRDRHGGNIAEEVMVKIKRDCGIRLVVQGKVAVTNACSRANAIGRRSRWRIGNQGVKHGQLSL